MMAPFTSDLPAGRGGRRRLAVDDLADYATLDLNGPPILADGKLFVAAKSLPNPQQQQRPAAAVRAGDPAARRQGPLEDRGRHVPRRASSYYFYYRAEHDAPAAAGPPRGGDLCRYARRASSRGSTPIPAGSIGASAIRPSPYQSSIPFFYYDEPQEPMAVGEPPLQAATPSWSRG